MPRILYCTRRCRSRISKSAWPLAGRYFKTACTTLRITSTDRTPKTSLWNTPFPAFNISLEGRELKHIAGGRLDYQLSQSMRVMGKVSGANHNNPFGPGSATLHPASTNSEDRDNREYLGQFTHVLSNRALNEVKVGFSEWNVLQGNLTNWSNHWAKDIGVTEGHPRVQMVGLTIGWQPECAAHPRSELVHDSRRLHLQLHGTRQLTT